MFATQLRTALTDADNESFLFQHGYQAIAPKTVPLAAGAWRSKAESAIRGSGYVVESLGAALWCFWTTDDFETAILKAVNLGDDADTTAVICGQLAGAYYGFEAIPAHWRSRLVMSQEIEAVADQLYLRREPPSSSGAS